MRISNLFLAIFPRFYIAKDSNLNEMVFWDIGEHLTFYNTEVKDKTQCEAVENHIHLFDRIEIINKKIITAIGICLAKNLFRVLCNKFPEKRFIVYLEVNFNDSTIIRFHQLWDGEPLYFDISQFQDENLKIYQFSNGAV